MCLGCRLANESHRELHLKAGSEADQSELLQAVCFPEISELKETGSSIARMNTKQSCNVGHLFDRGLVEIKLLVILEQ